jgi:hypothetical protein
MQSLRKPLPQQYGLKGTTASVGVTYITCEIFLEPIESAFPVICVKSLTSSEQILVQLLNGRKHAKNFPGQLVKKLVSEFELYH